MLNQNALTDALVAVSTARNNPIYAAEAKTDAALDLLHVAAIHAVADFNAVQALDAPTAKAMASATEQMNVAVNNYNLVATNERLNEWSSMDDKTAFLSYMEDQTVNGLSIKYNETGVAYLDEKPLTVSAYDWMNVRRAEELPGVMSACVIFADNCARLKINSTDDEQPAITRPILPSKYAEMRERLGWAVEDDKLSRAVLKGHLNYFVNAYIMPNGVECKMLGSDFRYVFDSLFQTVSKANKAGYYQTRNNETILNFIFRAVYTRYNKLPYDWQQDKAKTEDKPAAKTEEKSAPKAEKKTATKAAKTTKAKTAKAAKAESK